MLAICAFNIVENDVCWSHSQQCFTDIGGCFMNLCVYVCQTAERENCHCFKSGNKLKKVKAMRYASTVWQSYCFHDI